MEKMKNVIIDRVERGKSGQESWGKWQAWSVWFVALQPKFDYFEKDNVVPFPGMQVVLAEYTVEQDGQYTNYKLKKLVPAQLAGPHVLLSPPVEESRLGVVNIPKPDLKPSPVAPAVVDYEREKRLTMCTSYAKDLMVQILHTGGYDGESFQAIIELVAEGGKLLAERLGEEPGVNTPVPAKNPQTGLSLTPEPPALMPEMAVTPGMAKAVNEVLVAPVVLPIPGKEIPGNDIPF